MKQWLSQASHLATVIGVGIVMITGLVGAISYQTALAAGADVRADTAINTIERVAHRRDYEHISSELKEIKLDVKRIVSHLPPDRFWCKEGEEC